MIRLNPSLQLSRLVVIKSGKRAYDERYHPGVNIIRGVPGEGNSVGKSTIADMIFFSLGGDLTKWKDEASLCDATYAEVLVNGAFLTLRRDISDKGRQPMSIFFGDLEEAEAAGVEGWQTYPYQRYQDRQSFTQVLFRTLEMPEVPTEAESNITMHQLLRLMYVDQMTPVDRIFRFEANDSALRRQAVGDLLCGVFNNRIYPAQLQLREKERDYEIATNQYVTLSRVLTRAGEAFNVEFVESRRREISAELAQTRDQIEDLKGRRFQTSQPAQDQGILEVLQQDLNKINGDLARLRSRVGELKFEIEDADLLIAETERTLVRLNEGDVTLATIGPVAFVFCPSCFGTLDEASETICKLCHKEIDPNIGQARTARMRNELSLQLRESIQLQKGRQESLSTLQSDLAKLDALRSTLAAELLQIGRDYLTEADAQIDKLSGRAGYLERELVDIARESELAKQLADLSERRSTLNIEIVKLKGDIELWKSKKNRRQSKAYQLITSNTASILAGDLHTEKEFSDAADVYFDFAEDRISVNGKTGFSASSLTVLRNAFHLALHTSSCVDKEFRYPRFLLMDNIEDKGMTEARSQNFQQMIVDISRNMEVEHQIIFTTSMIKPSLNTEELTVGPMYDFDNKSLKIS